MFFKEKMFIAGILGWVALWCIALFLRLKGFNYETNYVLFSFLYVSFTILFFLFFRKKIYFRIEKNILPFVVLGFSIALAFFFLALIENFSPTVKFSFSQILLEGFFDFGPGFLFVKIFELLFQQVLVLFVFWFALANHDFFNESLILFLVLAICVYVPIFLIVGFELVGLYFLVALVVAFSAPPFIEKIRNGFVYNYVIHFLVYAFFVVSTKLFIS